MRTARIVRLSAVERVTLLLARDCCAKPSGTYSVRRGGERYGSAMALVALGLLEKLPEPDHLPTRMAHPWVHFTLTPAGERVSRTTGAS